MLRWAYSRFTRLFAGTELLPLWYRCLGARMGRGVVIADDVVCHDPHSLTVGDGAVIGDMAVLGQGVTVRVPLYR